MTSIMVQIVTFNNASTIAICLNSVLLQRGVSFSVCVVDNASQDETVPTVQTFNIPIIQNKTNYGYAAAHNRALENSQSPYVLTLNPDVYLFPDYLALVLAAMEQDRRIGSAMGCLLRVETLGDIPHEVDSAGLFMRRNRRQGLRGEKLPTQQRPQQFTEIFGPDGAAALYRREMLEDIRVLDEVFDNDFFLTKEDIDICWRARLRGWTSVYVPDATAHHVRTFRPGQRKQASPDLRFYSVRNRYLLMLKNDSGALFLRDSWAIILYELRILIYLLLFERDSLRALWAVFAMRRRILAKRRIVQSQRTVDWRRMRIWFRGE